MGVDGSELRPFVQIAKSFSDGLSIDRGQGPAIARSFATEASFECGRSYRTRATFVRKLVPSRFVTTLTVSLTDDSPPAHHRECVLLEQRTLLKRYSETTNVFLPGEVLTSHRSMLRFDPTPLRRYCSGLELLPGRRAPTRLERSEAVIAPQLNGDIS